MSFRLRYSLLGTGVVAAALLIFGWLVYQLVAITQSTDQDKALKSRATETIARLDQQANGPALNGPTLGGAEDLRRHADIFVEILDANGSVVSSTAHIDGRPPIVPPVLLQQAAPTGPTLATIEQPGAPQLRVAIAAFGTGYAVAGQPTSIRTTNLNGIKGFLIVSAIPTLLAAFVAMWLVTGRLSRRFNSLIVRLEQSKTQLAATLEAQRRFVADASHELRTPLTTIRGNAGLLAFGPEVSEDVRAAAARDIASETERMSRLVEQLLTLARADAGQHLDLTPISLSPLIEEVVRQAKTIHPDRRIQVDASGEVVARGDPDALVQLLWILVDNAVKFTKAEGCIAICLRNEDGRAELSVADDGTGISPEDIDRIFERFYQADPSRSSTGAGLGLNIARWIVDQHGGSISVRNNPGPGCTFTVSFPISGASLTASGAQPT